MSLVKSAQDTIETYEQFISKYKQNLPVLPLIESAIEEFNQRNLGETYATAHASSVDIYLTPYTEYKPTLAALLSELKKSVGNYNLNSVNIFGRTITLTYQVTAAKLNKDIDIAISVEVADKDDLEEVYYSLVGENVKCKVIKSPATKTVRVPVESNDGDPVYTYSVQCDLD